MTRECDLPDCNGIQRVVIRDPGGESLRVCVDHCQDALAASGGLIREMGLIECPTCCRPGCQLDATTRVSDTEGKELPVCRQHADDLSWIIMPGPLLSDDPGWSHG